MLTSDINLHKSKLSEVLGFGDEVKGFDTFVADDSIDHLEIYADFLGKQEYAKAKENYRFATGTRVPSIATSARAAARRAANCPTVHTVKVAVIAIIR